MGIGISEDQQSKIFTLFSRLDGNQSLNPQGCRLGLSISTILVQKLGGACIHVTSHPEHGSTFTFEVCTSHEEQNHLPYILEDIAEAPDEYLTTIRGIQICPKQSTYVNTADILIVDDVSFNRLVVKKMMETLGFKCAEASTGLQAVIMILASVTQGKPFKVVLMDVEMPEMDGLTATREIRVLEERGVLPKSLLIVGCSAYSSDEDKQQALASGMNHYLEKPISRTELFDLIPAHNPKPSDIVFK